MFKNERTIAQNSILAKYFDEMQELARSYAISSLSFKQDQPSGTCTIYQDPRR
jgi:hypothetical protein